MILCIVKIKNEIFNTFKEKINPEDYCDDVQWLINDLLIDETSVKNYPEAMRIVGGLSIGFSVDIFNNNLFTDEIYGDILDNYLSSYFINKFDPDHEYDDLKIVHVDEKAEADIRRFLVDNNFNYEMILM